MNPSPTVIMGNLTADPELTYTAGGQARLSFSVASNYVWYDQAGEKQEKVSYFNVVAWRYVAENSARTLQKGVGVIVTGRLEQRSWEDKETGKNRSTVEVIAEEVAINTRSLESIQRRQRQEGAETQGQQRKARPAMPKRQPATVGAGDAEEPF
jgi:single-strand DNA-binding protein